MLDFTDATDAIQKNAYRGRRARERGARADAAGRHHGDGRSEHGGLCSRYALAWMEQQQILHSVRTWISFDSPHGGADIPLGLQYWIDFFRRSPRAPDFRAILQRPAARQMLLHHFTTPATTSGAPDPLRARRCCRTSRRSATGRRCAPVSIANGSGNGTTQGFAPGAAHPLRVQQPRHGDHGQRVGRAERDEHDDLPGSIRILFSTTSQTVTVSNTQPWDGAPGGSRRVHGGARHDRGALRRHRRAVPVALLHFTVSALALNTTNPFFNVSGTPGLVRLTPFDTVYVPAANQEHVFISPENAVWVRNELWQGVLDAAPGARARLTLAAPAPNPSRGAVTFAFTLPRGPRRPARYYDVAARGRHARERRAPAGLHEARWDGRGADGRTAPDGVYFARLVTDDGAETRRKRAAVLR